MNEVNKKIILSPAICEHIDKWLLRYPKEHKRSGVFEALRVVQEENGWLSTEQMEAVADYLGLPHIAVFEVATFYTLFNLQPVGNHIIQVCSNISCLLNDAEKVIHHLKNRLGIELNETTKDGKYTLREVECLGACIAAPVCQIGKKYYTNLNPQKMDEIMDGLTHGK